ncbi:hypothetical protein D3C86_1861180 [compost metagenome]
MVSFNTILFSVSRLRVTFASASFASTPSVWLSTPFSISTEYFCLRSVKSKLRDNRLPSAFGPFKRMARKSKNKSRSIARTVSGLAVSGVGSFITPSRNSLAPVR